MFPGISILAETLALCYNEGYPPNQRGAHPFEKERKETVTIQRLEREEAHRLYLARFREDFVPSELRPWGSILRLMDQGAYSIFACKEAGEILAYAAFIQCPGALLLDYFAVGPARRGQGVGTAFFHGLQKLPALGQASCLYIEAESLESAPTPQERETRRRRIQFYTRCGCVESPWYAYLFGVEYRILLLPLEGVQRDSAHAHRRHPGGLPPGVPRLPAGGHLTGFCFDNATRGRYNKKQIFPGRRSGYGYP